MAERTIKIRFDGSARGLERAANKAARQLDKFGDQAEKSFARSGSSSGESFLDNFTKKIDNAADIAGSLGSGIARAFSSNPFIASTIAAALLGTLLVTMPAIGATVGAALVAALGAGLAGLGVMVQAKTDKVSSAFESLKTDVVGTLTSISAPLQDVILGIFDQVRGLVDFMAPTLEQAFSSMVPHIQKFFDFVFQGFAQFEPAIQPVTNAFNALLDAIGPMLPKIMGAISTVISDIANTIANNADSFAQLVKFFGFLAVSALQLVNGLTQLWVAFTDVVDLGSLLSVFSAGVVTQLNGMGKSTKGLSTAQKQAGKSIRGTTLSLKKQIQQMRKATDPVFRLTSAIKQVDRAQAAYTKAVNTYGVESKQARAASLNLAKAVANAEAAAKNGDLSFSAFQAKLRQWVGQGVLTEAQANNIAAAVRNARGEAEAFSSRDYGVKINADASGFWSTVASIPSTLDPVSIGITGWFSGFNFRAKGGPVESGESYIVGEKGPELFTPERDGRITSNRDLTSGTAQRVNSGGGGGGGPQVIENHIEIGGEVVRIVRSEVSEMKRGVRRAVLAGTR